MNKILSNKKILVGIGCVLIACVLILVILFSGKKIVCTSSSNQEANGYKMDTRYVITASGGKVSTVKIYETITSSSSDVLDKFEKQFRDQYEYNKKNYGGYNYKIVNDKGKVVCTVEINYKKFDMKKFVQNNQAMKNYLTKGVFTVDGARKLYESSGASCK